MVQLTFFHCATALIAVVKATAAGLVLVAAGYAVIPSSVARRYRIDAFDFFVWGLALFLAGGWIAVMHGHSLTPVIRLLLVCGPAAFVIRISVWAWAAKAPFQSLAAVARSTAKTILLFNGFGVIIYALHYYQLRPHMLQFIISQDLDLFQYANHATVLRAVGGSIHGNVAGYDFHAVALHDAFGAISLFSLFQYLPRTGPYDFTIPAVLLTGAGMSVAIFDCLKRVFSLEPPAAFFVAALALANPLNFYIIYNFFLSQLITTTLITILFIRALRNNHDAAALLQQTIIRLPFYIVQFLTYAPGLVMMLVLDGIVSALIAAMRGSKALLDVFSFRTLASIGVVAGSLLLTLGLSVVALPGRAPFLWATLLDYTKLGIAGWPLPLVSPYFLLGFGGLSYGVEQRLPSFFLVSYGFLIPLVLLLPFFLYMRDGAVPQKWHAAFVAGVAFALMVVGYAAFYLVIGSSYQQWKLASYGPSAFCWIGLTEMILGAKAVAERLLSHRRLQLQRFPFPVALPLLSTVFLLLDVKSNSRLDPVAVPANIVSISAIDHLPIKKVAVDLDSDPSHENFADQTMVPSLVTRPTLYMAWGLVYPHSLPIGYRPSPEFPLLTSGGNCAKAGEAGVKVLGGKYLLVSRNTLPMDAILDFRKPLSCAGIFDVAGVGVAETFGRWTEGKETRLHLYLSPEQARGDLVMTLVANAYVAASVPRQSVEVVVNGRPLAVWDFHSLNVETRRLVIPRSVWSQRSDLQIALKLPNAVSLLAPSHGQDHRIVALMLRSLRFSVH